MIVDDFKRFPIFGVTELSRQKKIITSVCPCRISVFF